MNASNKIAEEIRICRWLSEHAFKALTLIASYCGRVSGCSCFRIIQKRIIDRLDEIEDILDTLSNELDANAFTAIKQVVDAIIRRYKTVTIADITRRGLYIVHYNVKAGIKDLLQEYIEQGEIIVSKVSGQLAIRPHVLMEFIQLIFNAGYYIEDHTGYVFNKKSILNDGITLNNIELRDYQKEAIRKWERNHRRGVIALPTGAGKTILGLEAIRLVNSPTLIIVYTKEQMFQWLEKIVNHTNIPRYLIGLYYSKEKTIRPITITTYLSASRNINELYNKFSFLIVDEAHHLPATTFKRIALQTVAPYRLGLSATPYRDDGLHHELFRLMGGLVYSLSAKELVDKGYLAPFVIIPVYVELTPTERRQYEKLYRDYTRLAHGASINELIKEASDNNEARRALSLLSSLKKLVATSEEKTKVVKKIVEKELAKGSRILVFTEYIEHAERLSKVLGSPLITSRIDETKRRLLLDLFRASRYRVLVLTSVGDEGLDLPEADVGIILSTSISKRQFIQRLGRLLRPAQQKEARLYVLISRQTFEERQFRRKLLPALTSLAANITSSL